MTTRNQSLDVLRGVAILSVVLYHARVWPFSRFGWIGVDLFFVLSGFLVSSLIFAEYRKSGELNLSRFWTRRGLKIWPAFYAFILFCLTLWYFSSPRLSISSYLMASTFTLNYMRPMSGAIPRVLGAVWSLCVEEHFYILLPLLVIGLIKLKAFRLFPLITFAVIALVIAVRAMSNAAWFVSNASHLRFDSLLAGVLLSYAYHFRPSLFAAASKSVTLLSITLTIPAFLLDQSDGWMQRYGVIGLYIAFAFLVAWSVRRSPASKVGKMICRAASFVGLFSYSIYLWHPIVIELAAPLSPVPRKLVQLFGAILLGVCMAKLIEMPVLRIRDRMFPSIKPRSRNCSLPESVETSVAVQRVAPRSVDSQSLSLPVG